MKSMLPFSCLSLTALLLLPATLAFGQEPQAPRSLEEAISKGIQRSDLQNILQTAKVDGNYLDDAILGAGKTNDTFWVPYLRPFLKDRHKADLDFRILTAQMALAKLGEKDQLQEILCELDFGTNHIGYDAIHRKLKYVGGWFSIRAMSDLLVEGVKYRPLLKARLTDFVQGPPSLEVLFELPNIVHNPPSLGTPPPDDKMPETIRIRQAWREWIEQNRDTLQKLEPTGDGVEASEKVCEPVLKKDRAFDRSQLE
jgi:hypothetical protein